jgi:hypothetical protein
MTDEECSKCHHSLALHQILMNNWDNRDHVEIWCKVCLTSAKPNKCGTFL